MIRVDGVRFRHGTAPPVLDGVSLSVAEGEVAAILGPNGSGKSTLFRCIAGLWRQQEGTVRVNGLDTVEMTDRERALLMSVVPQSHEPSFAYSVFETVLTGRTPHLARFAMPGPSDRERVREALEAVGIGHLAERPCTRISGGERQLVLVARALVQKAPVMLLDEPTSHLDFHNQLAVLETVRRIARAERLTVLVTLHDPNLVMLFSDRVALLHEGAIFAAGPPDEVITADSLYRLYSTEVHLVPFEGRTIVYPKVPR